MIPNCPFGPDDECPNPDPNHLEWTVPEIIKHAKKVHHYNKRWLQEHGYIQTQQISISIEAYDLLVRVQKNCQTHALQDMLWHLPMNQVCGKLGKFASDAIIEKYKGSEWDVDPVEYARLHRRVPDGNKEGTKV